MGGARAGALGLVLDGAHRAIGSAPFCVVPPAFSMIVAKRSTTMSDRAVSVLPWRRPRQDVVEARGLGDADARRREVVAHGIRQLAPVDEERRLALAWDKGEGQG